MKRINCDKWKLNFWWRHPWELRKWEYKLYCNLCCKSMLPQLKKKKLKKSLRFPFFFFPLSLSKPQSPAEPPAQGLNLGQPRPIPSPLEAALLRPWSPRFSLFQLPPSLHCSISCHTISKSKAGKKKKKTIQGVRSCHL